MQKSPKKIFLGYTPIFLDFLYNILNSQIFKISFNERQFYGKSQSALSWNFNQKIGHKIHKKFKEKDTFNRALFQIEKKKRKIKSKIKYI